MREQRRLLKIDAWLRSESRTSTRQSEKGSTFGTRPVRKLVRPPVLPLNLAHVTVRQEMPVHRECQT